MPDLFKDILEFHEKFDRDYVKGPRSLDDAEFIFRFNAILEELMEYADARNNKKGLHHEFDAIIDLVYFALGTAARQGFDFNAGWERVHKANMEKVVAKTEADSKRGSTLDIVKPVGWVAPDLRDLTTEHRGQMEV